MSSATDPVPETQYFAGLRRDRTIWDNEKCIGVAIPSAAYPGELVLCLRVDLVKAMQRAMKKAEK